jgi:hypothetical protein
MEEKMKNRSTHVRTLCLGIACLALLLTVSLAAEKTVAGGTAVKILPDLIVKSVKVTKTGETAAGDHQVAIEAVVMNLVPKTSAGASKLKCEFTENPDAGFTYLRDAGVGSLNYSPALIAAPMKKLIFTHVVPRGKAYKYVLTADYTNMVVEGKEDNNVNNGAYSAL